jgi:uncharacterized protein (TIGR00369 family)
MEFEKLTAEEKEYAQQIIKMIPFVQLLGIELVDLERGTATCRLLLNEKHMRGGAFLHGGVTASLIDTATAFAVGSIIGTPANAVTVDLTIHYLRPILREAIVIARVLRAGKRLLTVSAEVFDENKELAATALTTYSKINLTK